MISNDLDIERWRRELQARTRVQIPDFLQPAAAERLHACLHDEVPWVVAEREQPDCKTSQPDEFDQQLQAAHQRARNGFHFIYDRYLMIDALKAGRDPHLVLHSVLEFFNGPEFLAFARYLSGEQSLHMIGAQATRYRSGQFLRQHDDRHEDEARRFAYVINLSREWEADWGGLLHFTDRDGQVIDSFVPRWNSLSLFKVPANHFVGIVAPWVRSPRLSITGWWHSRSSHRAQRDVVSSE